MLLYSTSSLQVTLALPKPGDYQQIISDFPLNPNKSANGSNIEKFGTKKRMHENLTLSLWENIELTSISPSQNESTITNDSLPLRGPGDSQFPFEVLNTGAPPLNGVPYELLKEKPKGIDPPDPYNPPLKKILFWNDVFGDRHYGFGFGREPFLRAGCRVNTCMTTADRKRFVLEEIDAVLWHFRSHDRSLPPKRYPHTDYVFWNMESASYLYGNIKLYNNLFNWVFSFRLDSDFPNPYGVVYRRRNPLPEQNLQNITRSKIKFAAWFVSHCDTKGGRQKLAETLQKWINIDIYGICGKLKCEMEHQWDSCYTMLERDYKFYVAFENSLCRDYATEKFFNILKFNVIPIVYGLADYHKHAPPHSYINALDFPSAKALADYLLYLNKNDTAYNEYFSWKRYHQVKVSWYNQKIYDWDQVAKPFCDLCEQLHKNYTKKVYDLYRWYFLDAHCKSSGDSDIAKFISGS